MRIDNDLHDDDPQEREISLGTSTILGIFLALALVCAAFFGFGYSLGRHSSPSANAAAPEAKTDKTDTSSPFSDFKSQPASTHSADSSQADDSAADSAEDQKTTQPVAVPQEAKPATAARPVSFPVSSRPATAPPAVAATPAASAITSPQAIVQVSATSREGDAEALIAALRQKGYHAAIRQVPQDKLFHVQLGPFASKKDAEDVRKRLDTDGYKAIVK